MKILEFIYNEKSISFDSVSDEIVMVNATEMAKAFEKRIDHFLKAEKTQEFIEALIETLNEEKEFPLFGVNSGTKNEVEFPPNGVNSDVKNEVEFPHIRVNSKLITKDDILQTRGKNGTWMHRILALEFAGWLDTKFKVWVWKTIDKILLGHYREVKAAVYEKMQAENARDEMKKRLLKDNPEFVQFLQLEGKITESEVKRQKAIKASMAQFKMEFQNS